MSSAFKSDSCHIQSLEPLRGALALGDWRYDPRVACRLREGQRWDTLCFGCLREVWGTGQWEKRRKAHDDPIAAL